MSLGGEMTIYHCLRVIEFWQGRLSFASISEPKTEELMGITLPLINMLQSKMA